MSKRPRTHVIEDIAAAQFTLAMQPRWIVRNKGKDYGVDLEAELLTDDDTPTGNIFYVQSKATDDEDAAQSVKMKTDRIGYLTSFEVPAMIVRYSHPTQSNYWMWATEAQTLVQPGAETVTIKFDERHRWTNNTLAEIERTLPILRMLKRSDHRTAFPLHLSATVTPAEAISLRRVADHIAKDLSFLRTGIGEIPILMTIKDSTVSMSIERIASSTANAQSDNIDDLSIAAAYLLADMLRSLDQRSQARKTARWCLTRGRPAPTDELAAAAAIALLDDPDDAVDLAILNNLHDSQGLGHAIFRLMLTSPFIDRQKAEPSVQRFYRASITAHEIRAEPAGAIRYSYANHLVSVQQYTSALQQFNRTRRDEPEYWNRPDFLRELGGLFFLRSHYSASAKAYRCSVDSDPTQHCWFCLGDAELHAGNFRSAIEAFQHVTASDASIGAEARLKITIAYWADENSIGNIGDWKIVHGARESAISSQDSQAVFWAHLALTFQFDDDIECWADAIYLALSRADAQLLRDILDLSVQRTRLEAYAMFKDTRADLLAGDPILVEELDRLVVSFSQSQPE